MHTLSSTTTTLPPRFLGADPARTPVAIWNGPPKAPRGLVSPEELLAGPAAEIRAKLTGSPARPSRAAQPASAFRQPVRSPKPEDPQSILKDVLSGNLRIVSHPGTGQYAGGSVSGCGLAAMNAIRVVVECLDRGMSGLNILEYMMDAKFSTEATSICSQWTSESHLSIDSIYATPLFQIPLQQYEEIQDSCGDVQFTQLIEGLNELSHQDEPAFAVITKTPEILCLFSFFLEGSKIPVLNVLFDSHPRSQHPDGAGLVFGVPSLITEYLSTLLYSDPNLMDESSLGWQAQLLDQFSAHIFLGRSVKEQQDLTSTLVHDASMDLLRLQWELSESTSAETELRNENRRLKTRLETILQTSSQHQVALTSPSYKDKGKGRAVDDFPTVVPETSSDMQDIWFPRPSPLADAFGETSQGFSTPLRNKSVTRSRERDPPSYATPTTLRLSPPTFLPPSSSVGTPADQNASSWIKNITPAPDTSFALRMQEDYARELSQLEYARELQKEFDEERRRLSEEHAQLLKTAPKTFDCGVCLETLPEDTLATLDGCSHTFCRECLLSYVKSKLGDRRFPIYCPVCVADKAKTDPGVVMHNLLFDLGVTEGEFAVFSELQIAQTSICVFCRGCKQSVYVDRIDHDRTEILSCPWPTCRHAWCKSCQQTVEQGLRHSCDGSLELDEHMRANGYRYCPGCRTPISRTEGCNHMTCTANGCNTHFCYRCGGLIIRSANPSEVNRAYRQHYSRQCPLFEYPGS